ncbi:MAG: enoyl-CoA hydratase-related protein [Ilumatobacter sp.]|uniref:enoyl-CoA hydratase-related protein n=1 Tax=Ilumatobacter sp. TaxID=1967498 RepID=UPI00391C9181
MVNVERHGAVLLITLDRPERRNAVDHATLLELLDIQAELQSAIAGNDTGNGTGDTDDVVRCVVLTGAPPAFSAGADLTGVEEGQFAVDLAEVLTGFGRLPVPVIAAIDGPALGAGTQLAVACDLRIATPNSLLGIPAAKLGLAVDLWTIREVERQFGAPIANAMLLAAETFTAADLHRTGGVQRLGDLGAAMEWAQRVAQLAPLTIRAHKLGLHAGTSAANDDDRAVFERARSAAWASDDATEGRDAFLAKRRPDFAGR